MVPVFLHRFFLHRLHVICAPVHAERSLFCLSFQNGISDTSLVCDLHTL